MIKQKRYMVSVLKKRCAILVFTILLTPQVFAHDIRPAYLEIKQEDDQEEIQVIWKISLFGNPEVDLLPVVSGITLDMNNAAIKISKNARIWEWKLSNPNINVIGQTLTIENLNLTSTDVMVKTILNGNEEVTLLKPEANTMILGEKQNTGKAILRYTSLGIEHIMLGIDHLLFVLGLLLLSKTRWMLVKTITSFTVGHSISLALATLGILMVPENPLNAVIALSIVFLGWELVRAQNGRTSLTIKNPWLVSFFFGIIHGIGFAGGLVKLGLPKSDIPLALLFFNVGVEIGQLVFILVVLGIMMSLNKMQFKFQKKTAMWPAYTIGSFASYWFINRMIMIF